MHRTRNENRFRCRPVVDWKKSKHVGTSMTICRDTHKQERKRKNWISTDTQQTLCVCTIVYFGFVNEKWFACSLLAHATNVCNKRSKKKNLIWWKRVLVLRSVTSNRNKIRSQFHLGQKNCYTFFGKFSVCNSIVCREEHEMVNTKIENNWLSDGPVDRFSPLFDCTSIARHSDTHTSTKFNWKNKSKITWSESFLFAFLSLFRWPIFFHLKIRFFDRSIFTIGANRKWEKKNLIFLSAQNRMVQCNRQQKQ